MSDFQLRRRRAEDPTAEEIALEQLERELQEEQPLDVDSMTEVTV